jgi:general secretion pathway protein G
MELTTKNGKKGFTLIELLIVITIIGILLTIAQPTYKNSVKRARETVLRENLFAMRSAIDQFYADNGTYPSSLEDLVQKGYLRSIPRDPITNSNTTWIIVPPPNPEETGVYDVKSGSNEISLSGTPYSDG